MDELCLKWWVGLQGAWVCALGLWSLPNYCSKVVWGSLLNYESRYPTPYPNSCRFAFASLNRRTAQESYLSWVLRLELRLKLPLPQLHTLECNAPPGQVYSAALATLFLKCTIIGSGWHTPVLRFI